MSTLQQVKQRFAQQHPGVEPTLVRSPGRVNIIGEHIDYNGGLVLPGAITFYIYMALSPREDDVIRLYSVDEDAAYETRLEGLAQSGLHWPDYILGVADQMLKGGKQLMGFNLVFGGDIPMGAGLSSSAALECATAFGLNHLFELGYGQMELARLGQAAENQFVGVQCGLMDQFASVFGQENKVMLLDCLTLEHRYIPFEMKGIKIVLFDTQVKHSLASSAYNERRQECERGLAWLQARYPEIESLRDATMPQLRDWVLPFDELAFRRCRFVVSEIARVRAVCLHMERADFGAVGRRMKETHTGLKEDYEVSCEELDFLVEAIEDNEGVLGGRMMGGGFGGCTINLVREQYLDTVIAEVKDRYDAQYPDTPMKYYIADLGPGTQLI